MSCATSCNLWLITQTLSKEWLWKWFAVTLASPLSHVDLLHINLQHEWTRPVVLKGNLSGMWKGASVCVLLAPQSQQLEGSSGRTLGTLERQNTFAHISSYSKHGMVWLQGPFIQWPLWLPQCLARDRHPQYSYGVEECPFPSSGDRLLRISHIAKVWLQS